jgi:NAD-dependent dihydropyrimidine dehydrogenase PreA subunit
MMSKKKTVDELKGVTEELDAGYDPKKPCIAMNIGTGCLAYGTRKQVDDFREGLTNPDLSGKANSRMMARGGMVVMDENGCVVNAAKFLTNALLTEPCGKCVPCREGIRRMRDLLVDITDGKGRKGDVELLESIAKSFIDGALCTRVIGAPNAVLDTILRFRDEYAIHVNEKRCPAGVCKELITYIIDPEKCTGCTVCARNCPTGAASGERKKAHKIDSEKCTRCGACRENCKFESIFVR